jgi:hypothetical protein
MTKYSTYYSRKSPTKIESCSCEIILLAEHKIELQSQTVDWPGRNSEDDRRLVLYFDDWVNKASNKNKGEGLLVIGDERVSGNSKDSGAADCPIDGVDLTPKQDHQEKTESANNGAGSNVV